MVGLVNESRNNNQRESVNWLIGGCTGLMKMV